MSTYWQRKKNRTRLRELEEMRKEFLVFAHLTENNFCKCLPNSGTVHPDCSSHKIADRAYEICKKYEEPK